MSKIKFELNRKGVRELLRSEEMKNVVKAYAEEVHSRCGDGYSMNTHTGKNRVNAMVYTDTAHAYYSNLKHNTLLKALK